MDFIICHTRDFTPLGPSGRLENAMYAIDYMLLAAYCSLGVSIQVESGRIIIDLHTFNIYGMPGPSLESIESDSLMDSADDNLFGGIHNVIYKATSQAFREYQKVLEKYEKHRNSDFSVHRKPAPHLFTPTITTINFSSS
jgi:hypothetical protein